MLVKFDPILGALRESDETTVVIGESYTHVSTWADLPTADSVNLATIDSYRVVDKQTGIIFINQKKAGFYVSTGSAWTYIGPNIETSSIKVGAVTVIGAPIEFTGTGVTITPNKTTGTIDFEVTKEKLGINNVDNTSDANKPVSTAQATAIDDAKNLVIAMSIALG